MIHSKIIMMIFAALILTLLLPPSFLTANDADMKHTGTVLSSQIEGNYAYIQLDVEGKEIWIATIPSFLKVVIGKGDILEYSGGLSMKNFKSKAMDKTFKSILFITKIKVIEKDSIKVPDDNVHNTKQAAPAQTLPPSKGEIEKAEGGKTIAQIYFEREMLKDKTVILQARVMKVSKNILKKNWITLQDGTGKYPDDKIRFTTKSSPGIGETIIVNGVVKTNIDLGGSYKYKVILEDVTMDQK